MTGETTVAPAYVPPMLTIEHTTDESVGEATSVTTTRLDVTDRALAVFALGRLLDHFTHPILTGTIEATEPERHEP